MRKQVNGLTVETRGDREVVMTRAFKAPRALVWACHTKPDLVKRWLAGPPGWEMTKCEIDLRVGGKYRYEWIHGPSGMKMGMGGEHRQIRAPELLQNTQLFDEDWTGGEAIGTFTLSEKDGVTTLTNAVVYSSPEALEGVLKTPMAEGVSAGYERLDALLTSL
jgi:uncharacterized protein YndB with AHSA1/START domain